MLFHVTGTIPEPNALGPYVDEETEASRQLQDEGSTLFAVRRLDRPMFYLLIEAADLAHAHANMARLPLAAAGVMTLEYTEVTKV
jgi:muconolactone delta-isomerase